jgi:hypothetical protein
VAILITKIFKDIAEEYGELEKTGMIPSKDCWKWKCI